MKMNKSTIIKYLKQGTELGWCDYDPKIASLHKDSLCKCIICLNTKEIFNSILEASKKYNSTIISQCCQGKKKSAGKLFNGTKLKWMYYDEYIKLQNKN